MTEHTPNGRQLQPIFRCEQPECGRTFTARHHFRMHLERGHMLSSEDVMALIAEQEQQGRGNDRGEELPEIPVMDEATTTEPLIPSTQQDYYEHAPLNEPCDLPPPPDAVYQKMICPLCGTGFLTPKNLQRHMDSTHPTPSQIMNYTNSDTWCNECYKSFSSKYNLDRHLELHRGVKYPCVVCKKVFTQKYGWSQHMKVTHGEALEEELW